MISEPLEASVFMMQVYAEMGKTTLVQVWMHLNQWAANMKGKQRGHKCRMYEHIGSTTVNIVFK